METFNKCVQTLGYSKSDNEKLASLMVISKISTPSIDLTKEMVDDLYRAVTSKFLRRLLKSSMKHDENAVMFKQLAVNVLSTISKINPSVIVADKELLDCLLQNLKLIDTDEESTVNNSNNSSFFVDLMELLTILAGEKEGFKCFSQKGIYEMVSSYFVDFTNADGITCGEKTKQMFLEMFKHGVPNLDPNFVTFLCKKSQEMKSIQEIEKFQQLDILLKFFQIATSVGIRIDVDTDSKYEIILKNLLASIHDMLKSRIKAMFKQKTIQLVSHIFEVFSSSWLLDKDYTGHVETFVLLLLTSVSVELTFIFSLDRPFDEVTALENVITCCFSIEKTILNCVCSDAFAGDELVTNNGFIVKVFNSFKATMNSVYNFLQHVSTEKLDHPIVIEALMMVSVWATEETESLRDELKSVIPLFMKVARKCLEQRTCTMTSKYFVALAPCVAQLLPEKTMRSVLNANDCLLIFIEHATKLLSRVGNKSTDQTENSTPSIECVLHIFHEYLILEYGYCQSVLWPKSLIDDLVKLSLKSLSDEPTISMYSICELVVLVLRLHTISSAQGDFQLKTLLPKALDFLSTLINEVMEYENSLDEIWHVAFQAISDLVASDKGLCDTLKKTYDFETKFPSEKSVTCGKDTAEIIQLLKRTVLM